MAKGPDYFAAAQAYVDTLEARGLTLGVVGDLLVVPAGHSPGELAMVRRLKPYLLGTIRHPRR